MSDIYFGVSYGPVIDSLSRLAALTGKETGIVLRNRASSLGRYLAEATIPVAGMDTASPDGGSVAARDLGRAVVARDIARVYVSPARIYNQLKTKATAGPATQNYNAGLVLARRFYKLIKNGDLAGAKRLLQQAGSTAASLELIQWDSGARHRQRRNQKGRVPRSITPVVVSDPKAVKAYAKAREKRVGFAKSGWITAAYQIQKGGRVAAWITNNRAPGHGEDFTRDLNHPLIRLTNQVPYISKILDARYEQRAIAAFEHSLKDEIRHICDFLAQKEQRETNAAAHTSSTTRLAVA